MSPEMLLKLFAEAVIVTSICFAILYGLTYIGYLIQRFWNAERD